MAGACLLLTLVVATGGCSRTDPGTESKATVACEVLYGAVDDGGPNAAVHRGMVAARRTLGVELRTHSGTQPDLAPLVEEHGCDVVVATGAPLGDAVLQLAKQHPDISFVIVDRFFDFTSAEDLVRRNVRIVAYRSDQVAFLAGYLAGGVAGPHHERGPGPAGPHGEHIEARHEGAVATFGGANNAHNRVVMDAFRAGVLAYGEDNDEEIDLLGWNGRDGLFTGSDVDIAGARRITNRLIDRGAGVVFSVAGGAGVGAIRAVLTAGKGVVIDSGGWSLGRPHRYSKVLLAGIVKRSEEASFDAVRDVARGSFTGGLEVGTLTNRGVDLELMNRDVGHLPESLRRNVEELEVALRRGLVSIDAADYEPTGHEHHN